MWSELSSSHCSMFLIFGVTQNENWLKVSYQFLPILMSPHVTRSQEKDPDTNFKEKWMKTTGGMLPEWCRQQTVLCQARSQYLACLNSKLKTVRFKKKKQRIKLQPFYTTFYTNNCHRKWQLFLAYGPSIMYKQKLCWYQSVPMCCIYCL